MQEISGTKPNTSYQPNCADEYLELVHDIAVDYDGCCTVEGLKSLIDEIVDYSSKARMCLHSGDIFRKDELKPRTNFDRIKAMNVEQFAEFIVTEPFCELRNGGVDCVYGWHESKCKEHARQYLESEVTE